jgi:hypothetical protein
VSPVDGAEILLFQKAWNRNEDGCLDKVMKEFHLIKKIASYNINDKIDVEAADLEEAEVETEE